MSAAILDNLDIVAVFAGGFFAGTAFYISTGEVPAIRAVGLNEHWRFFPYMFEKAAALQSASGVIAGVTGILHGTRIIGSPYYRNLWIISGSVFIGIIPYTLFLMMPTNKTIINDNKRVALGNESQVNAATRKELLDKWAVLHLGRTVSSVVAFGAMVFGLSRHSSLVLGW